MDIYNLFEKADIWWKDLKRVKGIKEKEVNWSTFKRYFKKKFLSEQYYEERAEEFYELKLGSMTMKDLNSNFLSLLIYVPYLVDEKPKVQRFLSCLPYHMKDRIEYDNPKTLEEAMHKANFCFEQNKNKEGIANWKAKKNGNQSEFKKKEFVPQKNFRNNKNRNHSNGKNFQGSKNGASNNSNNFKGSKEVSNNHGNFTKNFKRKEPVKCWECNGPHYASVCPNRKKSVSNIHTVQEEMTIGEL